MHICCSSVSHSDVLREILGRTDPDAFAEPGDFALGNMPSRMTQLREGANENVDLGVAKTFGRWLVEDRGPTDAELEAFREQARARAADGMPPDLVPANFRRAARFAWAALLEAASEDQRPALLESAAFLFEYVDRVSQIFSDAYAATPPGADEHGARALLERIEREEPLRAEDYALAERISFDLDRAAYPFVVSLAGASAHEHAALASRLRASGALACSEGRRVVGLSQRRTLEFDSNAVVAFGARAIRDERTRMLDELRLVIEAALALGRSGPQTADELLPELLLLSSPQIAGRLRERVYRPLGPELERTLDTLIEHDFERGSTAAALPVHRNTLRDRLRRIGDLTGVEFDTASGQAQAWLAYRARRVGA